MRFEGTVHINAPRQLVWDELMQESVFQRIAPGVTDVVAVVKHQRYTVHVSVPFGATLLDLPAEITWTKKIDGERLDWYSCLPYGSQSVKSTGTMHFDGSESCTIAFDSEICELPSGIPPALVHKITSAAIRQFFKNLKTEVEQQTLVALAV